MPLERSRLEKAPFPAEALPLKWPKVTTPRPPAPSPQPLRCMWQLTDAGQAFNRPFLIIFKNYNPRHIKLEHPVQQPYYIAASLRSKRFCAV